MKSQKEKGITTLHIIITVVVIILLSGVLYLWVNHTLRYGGVSERRGSYFQEEVFKNYKEEQQNEASDLEEETKKYQREEISFLKFVSSENCLYYFDEKEIAELKSLGVNGVRICPLYSLRRDGKIKEDIPEFLVVNLIKKAHQEGFAVFLDINAGGKPTETGEPENRYDSQKYIDELYDIALHWAKIAEKEKVEFFSPLNEPNLVFVNLDLAKQWISKSQELKPVFSGNLVLKLADIGPEEIIDISKYDYLAFDIMWGDSRYNELKSHLNLAINKGNSLKQRYNLKGFFFGELGAERSMVTKDVQAEIFKTILETSWGRVDGYCFLGWSNLEFRFKDNELAKEVIKKWYSR